MSIETLREMLLWCALLNYAVLLIWFAAYMFAHGSLQRIWGRWFHLTDEQFDMLNFGTMALYKVGILLLNLVPLAALYIVG